MATSFTPKEETGNKSIWLGIPRVGFGSDLHVLEPAAGQFPAGAGLRLCGVDIPANLRVKAHSDGDVALHAVIDALLGAAALGDIGEWFPDTEAAHRGRDSAEMLREVMRRLRVAGYVPGNLDLVIRLQAPKLVPYKPAMRERLAALLRLPLDRVSVKAKTGEGLGPVGLGQAIAAEAVALVARRE